MNVFHHAKDMEPKKLYVLFGGAGAPLSEADKPYFPRWSYYSLVENLNEGGFCVWQTLCAINIGIYVLDGIMAQGMNPILCCLLSN